MDPIKFLRSAVNLLLFFSKGENEIAVVIDVARPLHLDIVAHLSEWIGLEDEAVT